MTTLLCLVSTIRSHGPRDFKLQGSWHRIHSSLSDKTQFHDLATQLPASPPRHAPSLELWNPASRTAGTPPPSYDDAVADLPPDYTSTDALAYAQSPEYTPFPSLNASFCSNVPNCLRLSCDTSPSSSLFFDEKSLYVDIDFGFSEEGVRSHAKKNKNKNAAKKPAASSVTDDSKKDEEPAGSGDGAGGDPPADGGAGGGDGGDGSGGDKGAGDDGDGSGKKKTKKELKKEEEERLKKEEEERLAKEEEERLAKEAEEEAERQRKEEEDAAAAAAAAASSAAADLSWAEPTTNNDDWGSFAPTAGKKKKGKKGKVRNLGYVMTLCRALTAR